MITPPQQMLPAATRSHPSVEHCDVCTGLQQHQCLATAGSREDHSRWPRLPPGDSQIFWAKTFYVGLNVTATK